jgi:hypothetical protein
VSWAPSDLFTELDLLAYEGSILTSFQKVDWQEKRRKAVTDWLRPLLRANGFAVERFRTRFEPDAVVGFTGAAYSDKRGAAISTDVDDLNLATIFATAGSDALYVGSAQQFRGISLRMQDSVTSTANVLSVAYWADAWIALDVVDKTQKVTGKSFSGGGSVTWRMPEDWALRSISTFGRRYWVKLTVSATPASATAGQFGVIRHSALAPAVTFWTLALIMREAPASASGPWLEKAVWYEAQADAAWQRALSVLGGEFETDDPITDQISETESEQTTSEATGGPWRMERA